MSKITGEQYINKRQHYVFEKVFTFKLKPRLIYVGDYSRVNVEEDKHFHEYCEIILVTEGHATIEINDRDYDVKKGDIVIYNPYDMHSEKSLHTENFKFIFFAIDRFEIKNLKKNCLVPNDCKRIYQTGDSYELLYAFFNRMLIEIDEKKRYYGEILKELTRTALMYIIRVILADEHPINPYYTDNTLNIALDYIENNLAGDLSLDNIADNCFVSKYYLSHLFAGYKNMSIGRYVLECRLKHAKTLLVTTDKKVSQIGEAVGFNESGYFCRVFKKEVGCTPLEFRNAKNTVNR